MNDGWVERVDVNHSCCDIFAHLDSMQPSNLLVLLAVEQVEDSAAVTELGDNVEVILLLRDADEGDEVNVRLQLHESLNLSLEFLLVPLIQLIHFHFFNCDLHVVVASSEHLSRVSWRDGRRGGG